MLNRQYGVAASSSIVKVSHPEDMQPNERIKDRNRNLPPILNTVRPPRFDHTASNYSRLGTQMARRGSWKPKLPTRCHQESSSWSKTYDSWPQSLSRHGNMQIVPEAPNSKPTSSLSTLRPATHPAQPTSSTWVPRYKSMSPKLPPEPIRRRTSLDAADRHPPHRLSSPVPLPGRKRKAKEVPPPELPPTQKLKIEDAQAPSQHDIKHEPVSPESTVTSRRLVNEACSFWPTPDNCRKSVSNYSENRKEFARAQNKELAKLGLKRTKAFFREEGLVIEWRSEVPVWNDTLRPEKSSTASPKKSLSDLPSTNTGSKTVKKRDIIEIIDDDFTGDLPCKKPRPSDHESPTPSAQKVPGMHQKTPSPLKGKGGSANNAKHWSVGLSAEDIRKLGREVEATFLKRSSPLTSDAIEVAPSNSFDSRHKSPSSSIPPSSTTPPRRLALPTRLTPSERKFFSTPDKKVMSNADTVTAPSSSQSSELPVTASLSHEIISFNNDVDASFVRQSASTDEEDTPARAGNLMSVEVDTSTSIAFSLGIEERPADNTLRCDNDKAEVRTCGLLAEITRKPDGADLSEDETQEIQRMCTEDILVDPQEYEMAENFLRQFVHFFDSDRNELRMAYSNDALLSCRVYRTTPSPSSSSTLHIGNDKIIEQLNALIGHNFSAVGLSSQTIHYDIAVLSQEMINSGPQNGNSIDKGAVGGVLATLHSPIVRFLPTGLGLDPIATLHQSFVLRRRTDLDDGGLDVARSWPLIVVSHHMVLRDEPLLPSGQAQ